LNSVTIPAGVDEARVREQLLRDYSLEIGAGLGTLAGKVWRIGLMGFGSSRRNVLLCLGALETVLTGQGATIKTGAAVQAALGVYQS
jgi:alanine-glyoxylate transaminase/serine-glyoxylate transaminase/serine-pyruvate transaminase